MWGGRQTLCAILLLSVTLRPAARTPCSRDTIATVTTLIENVRDQEGLDAKLYTPTITDYRKCPRSTMTCFAKEARVLAEEGGVPNLNRKLNSIARMLNKPQLDCPQCELHTENTTTKFLENLQDVLRAINTEHCPKVAEGVVCHHQWDHCQQL